MIRIFCDRKEKDLKNFWSHIVFHPTDAIEDDWGKQHLERMAEDKAVRSVRIYTIFEEMFTLDAQGQLQADFSKNDYRIDFLLSKGFEPCIAYAFFPLWLAADQSEALQAPRYKGNILSVSYPSDYGKWEQMCRLYTAHLVERYGEDTVAQWYIHCYNEPDLFHFFYKNAPTDEDRMVEYCKLYTGFVRGITAVSTRLKIGGCALSESDTHFQFLEYFLNHVRENNLRLDFLSFHSYGTYPNLMADGTKPLDVRGAIPNTRAVARIVRMCGFEDLPLVCDEWGASTEGFVGADKVPELIFREDERYSLYYVKMLTLFDELELPYERMMLCLSGAHNLKANFSGHRNFFTKDYLPKPIYNAYVLAAKLGQEKLWFYHVPTFADCTVENLSVMPTRHEDGHFSVLLGYGDDGFTLKLPTKERKIEFNGLDKSYAVTGWVIDSRNANAYRRFLELGSPAEPTQAQLADIRQAGTLKAMDLGTVNAENNTVAVTMENNAVVLLELYPRA